MGSMIDLSDMAIDINGEVGWYWELVNCIHCKDEWLLLSSNKEVGATCWECGNKSTYHLTNDLMPGDWYDC
jgi:hypothetical protein